MATIDTINVTIKPQFDVSKETAEICARLLEIWTNADSKRFVDVQLVRTDDGYEQRITLTDGGEKR